MRPRMNPSPEQYDIPHDNALIYSYHGSDICAERLSMDAMCGMS